MMARLTEHARYDVRVFLVKTGHEHPYMALVDSPSGMIGQGFAPTPIEAISKAYEDLAGTPLVDTGPSIIERLERVHSASQGKGDQGAFDVWDEVAAIIQSSAPHA
jgi:hypothetical protein